MSDTECRVDAAVRISNVTHRLVCLNAWSLDSTLFLETVRSLESSAEDRWRRCLRGDRA